ncbi:hypothetical protein O1611_g5350 [Lasiodiplodia mahajangana]|uniref:Uncharacterized protein n=1 Tax=Lasiodiplodia mahajangana TaxID=1108764 RepID=A0ACC2JLB4_9PEZI|nr:hypothetical protein O1611_g5350 [Lasiodiplodia mahajangana]
MASWAIKETFYRVATQPGSAAKKWDKNELVRCRATGTDITAEFHLEGRAHPVFADWIEAKPEFHKELEQPILLASKILEAAGLPWLSDFLIDDIFEEDYPGRERSSFSIPMFAQRESIAPHSIVRHHRDPPVPRARQEKWMRSTREVLRNDFPKLVQWQVDEEIFHQNGWNGYTCRHPRGNLPLSEVDKYETIEEFDNLSLHEGSRNLTILIMAEYPARLAELRREGKVQSEEYLITAFMLTVTILHELGHAIYWRDRRSLTRDLREPFYGADLEMELGNSFIASIFGGWIPVPIRPLSKLRKDFSFADGVAWRQALNWDHHRMRPKYRAHYSIPVDYIASLFTEASWSTTPDGMIALIRPQSLAGNSIAMRTVGLHAALTQENKHATAAIADFHCDGHAWVWNRRPGAWFRISQYDGCVYPELELPTAGEGALWEPLSREQQEMAPTRDPPPPPPSPSSAVEENMIELEAVRKSVSLLMAETKTMTSVEVRVRGGDGLPSSLSSSLKTRAAAGGVSVITVKPSPRKSEYSPRKFALVNPAAKIPRPLSGGPPVPKCGMGVSKPRKRNRAKTLPLARDRAVGAQEKSARESLSPSPPPSRDQEQEQQRNQKEKFAGEPRLRMGPNKEGRGGRGWRMQG